MEIKSSRAVGNTDCAILSDLDGCSTPNPSLMSTAVCVRRWHDPAEKVRGRNLFVGKTRTLLSLNRKFIALSKSDDGNSGRIVVDVVTLEKNSPKKIFEQSMDARNCIWRAIRLYR